METLPKISFYFLISNLETKEVASKALPNSLQ